MGNSSINCYKRHEAIVLDEELPNLSFLSNSLSLTANQTQKIISIQTYFRSYLAKKQLSSLFSQQCQTFLLCSKFSCMLLNEVKFYSKLSQGASETLKRLGQFQYLKSNSNIFIYVINLQPVEIFIKRKKLFYYGQWNFLHQRHGLGKLIKDGELVEGEWVANKLTGHGRLIYLDGSYFIGKMKANKYHGFGKLVKINGYNYNGSWLNGVKEGYGKERTTQGDEFEGLFIGGQKAKGKLVTAKGVIKEGDFESDEFKRGSIEWADGRTFKGCWNESLTFKGIEFKWPCGDLFVGDYTDGLKEGIGLYFFDGGCYHGSFSKGMFHGFGTIKKENQEFKGRWRFGKLLQLDCQNEFCNVEKLKPKEEMWLYSEKTNMEVTNSMVQVTELNESSRLMNKTNINRVGEMQIRPSFFKKQANFDLDEEVDQIFDLKSIYKTFSKEVSSQSYDFKKVKHVSFFGDSQNEYEAEIENGLKGE